MKPKNLFALICILVILIQVVIGTTLFLIIDDPENRALFGDMFGVVNTLFTGLAFAGVVFTIILQSRELTLQRRELERAAKAQEKTQETLYSTMFADHDRRKKQATIEYMTEVRPRWSKGRRTLNDKFGLGVMTEKDIEKTASDRNLRRIVREFLGSLEHLALGVNTNVFDRDIVLRMSGTYLLRIYLRMRLYIHTAQTRNPRAYCEFCELMREFEKSISYKVSTDGRILVPDDVNIAQHTKET